MALATLLAFASVTGDADARARRHRKPRAAAESYDPAYASIVVDANSGAVMQASNADSPRHPASLTKIMTLYLLFERLEAGKIKLTTEMPVSAHAAAQAPSKLGLKPGETIEVGTAIRAIVTKSANDVAVVVAEALGGDETEFRQADDRQGARARHDAHDLPQRLRPARRQADHHRARSGHSRPRHPGPFPEILPLLLHPHLRLPRQGDAQSQSPAGHGSTASTASRPAISTNPASTSSPRCAATRHLVAVVFGGRSASARDARVISLINNNVNVAAVKRTAPLVVEGWRGRASAAPETKVAARRPNRPTVAAAAAAAAPRAVAGADTRLDRADQANVPVKTVTVQPGAMHTGVAVAAAIGQPQAHAGAGDRQSGDRHHRDHR